MTFCIHNIQSTLEIASTIIIELFEHFDQDFMPYVYLISDILFNTTSQNYRQFFARMIPFVVYNFAKGKREGYIKSKGELKAIIQIWEIKFIFDDTFTKGLTFLIDAIENGPKQVEGVHWKLKDIGNIP